MLFNSIEYLFFLPLVFLLYWLVCRNNRSRNLLIVAASFVFYGWWDWRFLCLMVVSCLCSFFAGLLLENENAFSLDKKKELYQDIYNDAMWLYDLVENLLTIL